MNTDQTTMQKLKSTILRNKILAIIVSVIILFLGNKFYASLVSTEGETRYVIGAVSRQTIITSISGSGQVLNETQFDIKPKVSGEISYLYATNGQHLNKGQLILQLDARDAQKTVRDAEVNLESAKVSLEKTMQPADALSVVQSENTLARSQESKLVSEYELEKSYENGFNNVSSAFIDIPNAMAGLSDVLFGSAPALDATSQNIDYYTRVSRLYEDSRALGYRDDAYNSYQKAKQAYDKNFSAYKNATRNSPKEEIERLVSETHQTAREISNALKNASNLIQFYKDNLTSRNLRYVSLADTHLTSLNTYAGQTNSHLASLLGVVDTIASSKSAITNADRSIAENTATLQKLKAGPDALDIATSQLVVRQRENALSDAKEKLSDYFIRAPFDGTVTGISVKKGDTITSGGIIASLITKKHVAEISLNEVDVALVKVGQKVTLTFDAIDELSITGSVIDVDVIGVVTQGVVNYVATISFDTQNDRIKPGMTVNADIITEVKQDALAVPASAIKVNGDQSYVEIVPGITEVTSNLGVTSKSTPEIKIVEIGQTNGTVTEISGLSEGDLIVVRTITGSKTTATQAPSLFGGSGGVRVPRN